MLRLVRVMQTDPKLGIVQGLVVGLPSTSAMARIFQFGMRLGMRSYTIGSAWWQGDCGPYWGHNAVLRLRPFAAHCELPLLAGGRHILSHDQIEAVLMRRAGYEVRVLPEENLGWEENPPTLIEFIRRDLRWCAGNMQYWPFLLMPGLKSVSRYQLLLAILMFLGSPAWIGLLLLGTARGRARSRSDRSALRMAALRRCSGDVVRRQDREHPRRAGARRRAARIWRQRTLSGQRRNRNAVLHPAGSDPVVQPYDCAGQSRARPHHRLERPGPA